MSARFPIHIISSSSDSDGEDFHKKSSTKSVFACETKTLNVKSVADFDVSDDDDCVILPLRERILKSQRETKLTSSSDSDWPASTYSLYKTLPSNELPLISKGTCAKISVKNDEYCKPTTSADSVKNCWTGDSDIDSLPDLDDDFPPFCPPSPPYSGITCDDVASGDKILADQTSKSPRKKKRSQEEILAAQQQKLGAREEKAKIQAERLAAKEREKKLKDIRRQEFNSIKPGECIKSVVVRMDLHLLELPEAVSIPKQLQESNMQYHVVEQFIPNCITWRRKFVRNILTDDLRMVSQELEDQEENQLVVILTLNEFLIAVNNFKTNQVEQSGLISTVQQIKELYPMKIITLVTCGLEKYFSAQKNQAQRQYRQHVLNEEQPPPKNKRKKRNNDDIGFDVSRFDVEEALVDLQIRESCSVYMLADSEELALLVVSITKAIAEAPFKQGKMDNGLTWYATADTKDSVKVDKDGNGLKLLWQRQLQQLNLVSADTAQAIISHYPTPSSLIAAYKNCSGVQECQMLLQNIIVRRGVGPLSTTRRIGSELSRKIYVLFTSKNGDEMLDAYQC